MSASLATFTPPQAGPQLTTLSCLLLTPSPVLRPRDEHYGFQLYQSDPSGNYGGWKATAIGAGHAAANNLLKTDYNEDANIAEVSVGCRGGEVQGTPRLAGGGP